MVVSRFIAILFLSAFLSSCGNDDIVTTSADTEIQAWLDTMGISATRDDDTGIYYYEEVDNPSGAPVVSGAVVAIYYSLRDPNGNLVAQHLSSDGDSLVFKVGASAVYPLGLDFGVSQMRVGEVYTFILPPAQAYVDLTSGDIDSRLIAHLQVQLVGVHNESDLFTQENVAIQDYIDDNYLDSLQINPLDSTRLFPASGIVYKRRAAGSGSLPLNGDTIIVDYAGRFIDDSAFASASGFQWYFGSGEPRELLPGFEFGVSLMQTGEEALIMIPSSQGYRESALVVPEFIVDGLIADGIVPDYVSTIPPYRILLFEITRID